MFEPIFSEPLSEEEIKEIINTCDDNVSTNCLGCAACEVCPYLRRSFELTEHY